MVHAAQLVAAGQVSPHQGQKFRNALGRVANDSVDLFILLDNEQAEQKFAEIESDEGLDDYDEEAWLDEW